MSARAGFNAATWKLVRGFGGRCATPHDVEEKHAVFALGETLNGRTLEIDHPQPVIWYDEDEEFAALIIQAETHETEDGESLDVLGLLLPGGETKVAFLEDVDQVAASDPVWLSLLEADLEDEDGAEWASEMDDDDQ